MKSVVLVVRILALGWLLGSLPALAQEIRQPIERNGRVTVMCQVGEVAIAGGDEAVLTVTTDGNPSTVKVKQLAGGGYGISIDPPMTPHRLRITVPREASLQEVRTRSANVTVRAVAAANVATVSGGVSVEQVPGPVNVATTSGRIRLTEVGTVQLRTVSGDAQVQAVTGSVAVSAVSGKLEASDIGGDLTAQLVSGNASIRCSRGRVEVSTVSGDVRLSRLENEVAVETTSGNVFFVGALTPVKRCTINAFSGDIRLAVPETCGFETRFRSFSGALKSDFPVDGASTGASVPDTEPPPPGPGVPPPPPPRHGRFVTWRHGDGAAKVLLSTFSGTVSLVRADTEAEPPCRRP
ncbi:DUF4097 family beta strand repeat protein [Chloracidobacterium sp. MS 40/45]|uniref:DUF4097 family beta strand repeat-containing protein n=1 Tax=Chloracidobacterium aggregatum TaxID=2851959 RepID=UPI001B8B7B93|nr:DUF4097 family beta strand repeat-containing protein [Chloracidobacterium aggregatum]QUW01175.1 DUF4097 family beta strand repeat protein [Chloracidobacterium sp. MS 40/45]